jgi:hypothetical protein
MSEDEYLLKSGIEFCSYCSAPVNSQWKYKPDSKQEIIVCPFCRAHYTLSDQNRWMMVLDFRAA